MTRERIAGGGTGSERRPNWKDPECSIEEKNFSSKNLSGIEYGGAEEAKKDESWDYSSFDKPLLRPPTIKKFNASFF